MHKDFKWDCRYTGAGQTDFTEESEKCKKFFSLIL